MLTRAIAAGALPSNIDSTLSELIVLGLLRQGVRTFFAVFGHGSTEIGEVLRVYQESGLVNVLGVRNEIEASHAATALNWVSGEPAAVITSIGPGAMQALAASLVPASDGIGVWYLMGDETMTLQAAAAGKHISVQKPMALSASEADEMIAATDNAGVVLWVYENFVHYEPARKAKALLDAGEIGNPIMLRMHINTGSSPKGWKIPLDAWVWRFNENKSGGGELVFDHGYNLFSLAYDLMGQAQRVSAWIGKTSVAPGFFIDAPATIMFQFQRKGAYGVFDIAHTPDIVMDSKYYSDDDRVEVVGKKGILFINRNTTNALGLPELVLFKDGKTQTVPTERVTWANSFEDTIRHLPDVLGRGGNPKLDGPTGKAVLQMTLAAQISAREGREVEPETVP